MPDLLRLASSSLLFSVSDAGKPKSSSGATTARKRNTAKRLSPQELASAKRKFAAWRHNERLKMNPTKRSKRLALTPLVLMLLLSACASVSPSSPVTVESALILPLSVMARQPPRSESFSQTVQKDIQSWDAKLTPPATLANDAKASTTPLSSPPSGNK